MKLNINPSEQTIKELLGKPCGSSIDFNFFAVDDMSLELMLFLIDYGETQFITVRLHQKGILITFIEREAFLTVAVEYHFLTVYKTDFISLYINDESIHLNPNKKTNELMVQLITKKAEYQGESYYGGVF